MPDQPDGDIPDAELVWRAAQDSAEAWELLVSRYSKLLWAVARSYGLSTHDAQDVAQTVWRTLAEHLPRLRHPESLRTWLAVTAQRESFRHLRARHRARPCDPTDLLDIPTDHDPAQQHVAGERARLVREALRLLPVTERIVAVLRMDAPELTVADIAEIAGVPAHEVRNIRRRAFRKLRSHLEPRLTEGSPDT
ncbi:RNA polymerase sigma factor [Salinactinospora qingdaonensis]|uniref:RNA polymerase sigma factor, sigma-70 family n=1 Tax=Salinactinospora qingdaonensis TaxID=702744 RepID=A0ABP7ERG9_9ACTN